MVKLLQPARASNRPEKEGMVVVRHEARLAREGVLDFIASLLECGDAATAQSVCEAEGLVSGVFRGCELDPPDLKARMLDCIRLRMLPQSFPTRSTAIPKSHTLHPTPYTLHPAPCTLHPAPYTLYTASCILHTTTNLHNRQQRHAHCADS
jgi:hypothetical protein